MSVTAQPPPPPPPSPPTNTDYYYLVLTVAAVAVILVLSNIIAFACCSPCHPAILRLANRFRRRPKTESGRGYLEQPIPITRYRKEEARYGAECSVCLMAFGEGEEVRQLPVCMHLYHVACIDMWLWSHSSCPVCRGRVRGLPPLQRCPAAGERQLFTESRSSVAMITVPIMF